MKTLNITFLFLALLFAGFACDSNSTDSGEDEVEAIVGTWLSQGTGNIAPGLASLLKTAEITATFEENATYNVVSTDSAGAAVTFTGTYELGPETASGIRSIKLNQAQPSALVSTGIFQVEGTTLTYEVIQTDPNIGAEAPTVEGGFGSTSINGTATGIFWVQKFAKQN